MEILMPTLILVKTILLKLIHHIDENLMLLVMRMKSCAKH
jgi:hypothetical protein